MKASWVTYADSDAYYNAAMVLWRSLKRVGTLFDFVVMVPRGFAVPTSDNECCRTVVIKDIFREQGANIACERFRHAINKIHVWTLCDYDMICWLDSDMIVLKNIDHLFSQDIPLGWIAAAPGCLCNHFKNEKFITKAIECPFLNKKSVYVNAGLFVTRPCMQTFAKLADQDFDRPFAEQDVFNDFFAGRIHVLDCKYNYLNHLDIVHPNMTHPDDICIYHFCFGKPWNKNDLNVRQDLYNLWLETR